MSQSLFISYAHRDMADVNWLDRLRAYLAPLRRRNITVWEDSQIATGARWEAEIKAALEGADAAVLLVGPAFFASEYIATVELPRLLAAIERRGISILPLVVGYCDYAGSPLGSFQALNDHQKPLEALPLAEQNRWLNELGIKVDAVLRHGAQAGPIRQPPVVETLKTIGRLLSDSRRAIEAQGRRRDALVDAITKRLGFENDLEYEQFFLRQFGGLTAPERFEFDQIRALTEGPMAGANRAILEMLEHNLALLDEVPLSVDLQQHLVFWLNKYERVFVRTPAMCVLYTGVEDGVPFPGGLDRAVAERLERG